MNVSVTIPTRGDVDLQPILDSFPSHWETIVWDNSGKIMVNGKRLWGVTAGDLAVYARYAAIAYATNGLILTQDDDVIVSDPQAIVDAFVYTRDFCAICNRPMTRQETLSGHIVWACDQLHCVSDEVVCNMPQEFRPHYPDSALVGFGAAFHRDAPGRAFARWSGADTGYLITRDQMAFNRACDVVFTTLTPRVLVDVPKVNLPYATGDDRMYRQPEHVGERARMLDLARRVRES